MSVSLSSYWTDEFEAALTFMDRVARHPVDECGEPVVDIGQAAREAEVPLVCATRPYPDGGSRMPLLRRGVVAALLAVASDLARDGLTLVVEDAFRTRAIQRGLAHVDDVVDGLIDVMTRAEPALDVALVARRLATVVAGAPKTAGHMAGAAVDVSVLTEDGSDLDRGAPYLTVSEVMPMDSPFISAEAAANRRYVTDVMLRHGFVAYPYEFWHYCRDDALARVAADDPTPARYGAIDLDGNGGVVAMDDPLAPLNPEPELRRLIEARFASRRLEA